jgi:hypothetical protein
LIFGQHRVFRSQRGPLARAGLGLDLGNLGLGGAIAALSALTIASVVGSYSVASTWPFLTCCPTWTSTLPIWPATAKFRATTPVLATVPTMESWSESTTRGTSHSAAATHPAAITRPPIRCGIVMWRLRVSPRLPCGSR